MAIILTILFGGDFGFLKKLKKILWLFVGIAIIQSIFSPSGTDYFSLGKISVLTSGGLEKGIRFILRMLIIIISATIMASLSTRKIVQGFVKWKVPYEIAFMVSLATRFLPLLREEIKDVLIAFQLRGVELDKIPIKKRLKYILIY